MVRKLRLLFILWLCALNMARAQKTPQVELFCGAELNYADVNFTRLYNVLVNLTPGVKYHMGNDWMLSGQFFVPIVNQGYEKRYEMLRLNMMNIAKEVHFNEARQHLKFTAGLFGLERYGIDTRWMYPINSWLMVNARLGVTSRWALGFDFKGAHESDFENDWALMAYGGASIWLDRWNTEFRAIGGRFMNKDYGVEGEVMRHFKHVTVTLFGQLHKKAVNMVGKQPHTFSGGFRIVMMLPPYKKSNKTVVFRPASNFRLTYNAQSDGYSVKRYNTDPEENERTQPIHIPWGTGNFNE